jgi:peptidoglycan/LPS O-acetylase OafA/YrhL
MATTKDRLEQLTNAERELHDYDDVVAPEDSWGAEEAGPPPAAGHGPAVTIARSSLGSRLLEPISGRWAAIGAIAWVLLVGIGIAVEPPPTNPDAVDPWFLDALGTILLATVVGAFAGFWLRRRWGLAASLVASGLLVASTLACPASGHHTQVGPWWVVQLGCGLGLVATSLLGLRRG